MGTFGGIKTSARKSTNHSIMPVNIIVISAKFLKTKVFLLYFDAKNIRKFQNIRIKEC